MPHATLALDPAWTVKVSCISTTLITMHQSTFDQKVLNRKKHEKDALIYKLVLFDLIKIIQMIRPDI